MNLSNWELLNMVLKKVALGLGVHRNITETIQGRSPQRIKKLSGFVTLALKTNKQKTPPKNPTLKACLFSPN